MSGQLGCPHCGCAKFRTTQQKTEYCDEEIVCKYDEDTDDPDSFDILEYGDSDCQDSENGDVSSTRTCCDCGEEYKASEAKFRDDHEVVEDAADALSTTFEEAEALLPCLRDAASVSVEEAPHATLLTLSPKVVKRGKWNDKWTVEQCCKCGGEMSDGHPKTEFVYQRAPTFSGRERVLDSRQLPILVRLKVCRHCR